MQDAAQKIIDDIGKDVTLRRVTQGAFNTTTGALSSTTSDETVQALFLNFRNSQVDGSQIKMGDRKIVIAAQNVTKPETDDLVISNSKTFRIIQVIEVEENDKNLIYTCQAREQ